MLPRLIDLPLSEDSRGSFLKLFCSIECDYFGNICQVNVVRNKKKGTIRGLHFQREQYAESKLLYVVRGAIFDVLVDLQLASTMQPRVYEYEISASERKMLLIPKGFAHGYQTLKDNTEILYLHNQHHEIGYESGIHPFDPKLKIKWPYRTTTISKKDMQLPYL